MTGGGNPNLSLGKVKKVTYGEVSREATEWVISPAGRLFCEESQSEPWKTSKPEGKQQGMLETQKIRRSGVS